MVFLVRIIAWLIILVVMVGYLDIDTLKLLEIPIIRLKVKEMLFWIIWGMAIWDVSNSFKGVKDKNKDGLDG
jgi:hypothetical protein